MALFTTEELKRIEAAVAEAETKTSGEIVVHYADRSAGYRWVPWAGALAAAFAAGLVTWAIEWRNAWPVSALAFFEAQAVAALVAYVLAGLAPVRRLLVSNGEKAQRVHEAALAQFMSSGVAATRDRTGILVFISALEHRVEILADTAIHEVCGPDYWKSVVDSIVKGIRGGKAADAVCQAVGEIGARLSQNFPRRADDENELPNAPTSRNSDNNPKT